MYVQTYVNIHVHATKPNPNPNPTPPNMQWEPLQCQTHLQIPMTVPRCFPI